jgi:hypothetical protein
MPGLIKVRTARIVGVANQPLVDRCVDLKSAIGVFGVDRISADIKVEGATGEVRAVYCETSAAGVG